VLLCSSSMSPSRTPDSHHCRLRKETAGSFVVELIVNSDGGGISSSSYYL
jgi:hypothetical protein